MKRVLLILPAYNEEENILKTVNNIRDYSINCNSYEVDYIVINDGSKDKTEVVCKENDIKVVNLISNLGIGGAVQTGYIYALIKNYDIAVQFDGDGQHDINSLNNLIYPILNDDFDFVIGSRFVDGTSDFKSTFLRRVGIKYLSNLISVFSKASIKDPTSGYRAANKKVIEYLSSDYPIDYPEPESIVSLKRAGFRLGEIQVNMLEREGGISSINNWQPLYYMIKVTLAVIFASFQRKEKF